MNNPKLATLMCPMCGATMPPVPPTAVQIQCRFCQNLLTIARGPRPANLEPNAPSRTLYVNAPLDAGAKALAAIIIFAIALPILIPLAVFVGPPVVHLVKNAVHPYPTSCDANDEISSSGNWTGTTPILANVGVNCKVHITNGKIKGSVLFAGAPDNLELWLENVTIETTDVMMKPGGNFKLHIKNSTLTSQSTVIDQAENLTADITGSTLESQGGTAIKAHYNFKVQLDNAKIRGKKIAVDADSNMELGLKNASEVTSADGVAIKATDNLHITSEGGKIDGGGGAIVIDGSNLQIKGSNLTINSAKDKAIATKANIKIELTDSAITSAADDAIDAGDNPDLTLENTTISGVSALQGKSNLNITATKKSHLVGTTRPAIEGETNGDLVLSDSTVESAQFAIKNSGNLTVKLQSGAKITGKQGGISTGYNFKLNGQSAAIIGGAGPALYVTTNAEIALTQSTLSGNPAISYERKIQTLDLTGTTVTGAQVDHSPLRPSF